MFGSVGYDDEDRIFYGKIEFIRALVSYEGTDVTSLRKALRRRWRKPGNCTEGGRRLTEEPLKGSFNVRLAPNFTESWPWPPCASGSVSTGASQRFCRNWVEARDRRATFPETPAEQGQTSPERGADLGLKPGAEPYILSSVGVWTRARRDDALFPGTEYALRALIYAARFRERPRPRSGTWRRRRIRETPRADPPRAGRSARDAHRRGVESDLLAGAGFDPATLEIVEVLEQELGGAGGRRRQGGEGRRLRRLAAGGRGVRRRRRRGFLEVDPREAAFRKRTARSADAAT